MPSELLLIGFDGFDPDLSSKWMSEGLLPNLAELTGSGCFCRLESTIPPFTYPAWSSLLTGVNPGRHGIIDFVERIPGTYRVRFVNSTHRKKPGIFELLSDSGLKSGAMGFPCTYPPSATKGFMISGFDSPVAVNASRAFCQPPALYEELKRKVSPYTLAGIQEVRIGPEWHGRALLHLLDSVAKRTAIAEYLYGKDDYALFAVVFSESDTVSHHFWSYHDPQAPRGRPNPFPTDPILKVYQALDNAAGELIRRHGRGGWMIVSDHGFGPTASTGLLLNRILESGGMFNFKPFRKTGKHTSFLHAAGLRLPVAVQEGIFRHLNARVPGLIESRIRLARADLKKSVAFSDELNYFPSVWVHDRRFPMGMDLKDPERSAVVDTIVQMLAGVTDPFTGSHPVRRIFKREEIYQGACTEMMPDVIVDTWSGGDPVTPLLKSTQPGSPMQTIDPADYLGAKGRSMNGSHRQDGILFASKDMINTASAVRSRKITDIAPTILGRLRLDIPVYMDGSDMRDAGSAGVQKKNAVDDSDTGPPRDRTDLTEREASDLKQKLSDLGYL